MSERLQKQAAEEQVAPVLMDANRETGRSLLLIAAPPDDETINAAALQARA